MSSTLRSSSLRYGTISGIAITVLYVLFYVLNVELLANFWISILIMLALFVIGFISAAKAKSINGGFLTFKEAFSAFIIPIAIGLLIPTFFIYILFNFIDPESAEVLKEIGLEKAESIMRRFGAPESEIEKALADAAAEDSYSIKNVLFQYGGTMVFSAVIGLIAALIMKKKKED